MVSIINRLLNKRYKVIKEIGRGAFGVTYLAEDIQTSNAQCVVKKLNSYHADIAIAQRLFQREAETLKSLKGVPQIPKFLDYFIEDEEFYLAQEYIEGSTLDKLVESSWDTEDIYWLLTSILSILKTLHQQQIIHRDIKPSNLIQTGISQNKKIFLIDLGAVKQLEPNQDELKGTSIYTHGYTPPEQIGGKPRLNSDIYALGVTAIQLLTKIAPDNLNKDSNDNIVWGENTKVDDSLAVILNKMVKSNYRERYQSVEEVLQAIDRRDETRLDNQNNQVLDDTKIGVPETHILTVPTDNSNYKKDKSSRNTISQVSWYYWVLLAASLLIASEFVTPWMRPQYYLFQANSLLNKHQSEESLKKFNQVIDLKPNSFRGWKGRGDALFTMGRDSGAVGAYQKAEQLQPNNLKLLNNLGKVYYEISEYQKALEAHQRALEIDDNNAEALSGQGIAYLGLQDYEKSLESFNKAQNIKPNDPSIWLQKGLVLNYLNRPQDAQKFYEEALNVYDEILDNKPDDSLLWTDRGFVLLQLNRPEDALKSYDTALDVNNNFYEALLGQANALILVQEYEKSLSVLEKATKVRPEDYQAWYSKGNLLGQVLQQHQAALDCFKQTTTLNPYFAPGWLSKGLTLMALKQNSDALESFEKAQAIDDKNPYIWLNKGLVLENLGNNSEALKAYTQAVELGLTSAVSHQQKLQNKIN